MKKRPGSAQNPPPAKKNLGPLEKAPKKRWRMDPSTKVVLTQVAIGLGLFALLGLTVAVVWWVTRLPSLTISEVTASGGETISAEEVIGKANGVLEGTYGRVVPKRFFAFYPHETLLHEVGTVDRIKDVIIERFGRNELRITYGEYFPYALWCVPEPADACLFLDERGYAFAPAPQLKGGNFVRYRHSALTAEIGKPILSFDDFWKTVTLTELLATDGQFVRGVDVDTAGDVYYALVGGGELRASLSQEPQAVFENLRTILNSQEFSHLRSGDFKYIDLRFGNKVYINEELESSLATSTATSSETVVVGEVEGTPPEPEEAPIALGTSSVITIPLGE